jgi:hypothetical protein
MLRIVPHAIAQQVQLQTVSTKPLAELSAVRNLEGAFHAKASTGNMHFQDSKDNPPHEEKRTPHSRTFQSRPLCVKAFIVR